MNRTEYTAAASSYLAAMRSSGKSEQTKRGYTMILSSFGEYLARIDCKTNITALDIISYRAALVSRVKPNTAAHYLTVLHSFFEWTRRVGIEQTNPVPTAEIPKAERIEYDLLTLSEIDAILTGRRPRGTNKKNYCRNRAVVLLLLQSGIRSAELRDLTPADIDFEKNVVRVRHGKGDKYREAPFPKLAREAVAEYLKARDKTLTRADYLFGSYADENGRAGRGGEYHKMTSSMLLGLVKRYVENTTGHKDIGTHDLRHAFASYASNKGVATRDISLCLGHANEAITERVYISILDKRKAPTTVNAALDA